MKKKIEERKHLSFSVVYEKTIAVIVFSDNLVGLL